MNQKFIKFLSALVFCIHNAGTILTIWQNVKLSSETEHISYLGYIYLILVGGLLGASSITAFQKSQTAKWLSLTFNFFALLGYLILARFMYLNFYSAVKNGAIPPNLKDSMFWILRLQTEWWVWLCFAIIIVLCFTQITSLILNHWKHNQNHCY